MKRKNLLSRIFAVTLVLFAALSLNSCKPDATPSGEISIFGTWKTGYGEVYEINFTDLDSYGDGYLSYAGNNLLIKPITNDSGYIYIKYTRAFCSTHSDFPKGVYTYDEHPSAVGKWYAIYYSDLTADSVSISGCSDGEGKESLTEAIENYTKANGNFNYSSECVRIK